MTGTGEGAWLDGDAGPVVRPYAMISGRTRPSHAELDLISLVIAAGDPPPGDAAGGPGPEATAILRLCREPQSVAEVSAHLDLPAGTVKVLLGDLIDQHLIVTRSPAAGAAAPAHLILEAVMHGLNAL